MGPRLLIYDIETMAERGWYWPPRYETRVLHTDHYEHMMSVSWKWFGEKKVHVMGLDDFHYYKKDRHSDKELVKLIRDLFEEADVVVAHNGNQFDQKVVNARILTHHLSPPTPYKQIDTKLETKRVARFASNKLDDLGKQLELGQKLSHGTFEELWIACDNGDAKAWKTMKRYNKQDVVLLEQLYLELRPWMANHPSMSLMNEDFEACPKCGGGPLTKNGWYFSKVNKVQVWTCKSCGGHPRSRISEKSKEKVVYV